MADLHFESGVSKVQQKEVHDMTEQDKKSSEKLLKKPMAQDDSTGSTHNSGNMSMAELLAKTKRKRGNISDTYIDCRFSCGLNPSISRQTFGKTLDLILWKQFYS